MSTDSNIEKRAIMEIFADDHLPVYTATTETILQKMSNEMNEAVRIFATGATRSPLGDKLRYADFMDSRVIKRYCQYLNRHRIQSDGQTREPNNWKHGIDQKSYVDSGFRHMVDVLLWYHGYSEEMEEDIETALCALMFNVQGLLFEILREGK